MPLIYITGISGSGKSTVLEELSKRGLEAHGVDEEGYADWIDRQTGEAILFPEDEQSLDIHDWYKKHRWILSLNRISELKKRSDQDGKQIILAGSAEGESTVRHLFNKVIYLAVDEPTLKRRIAARENNLFGKHPDEMAEILQWLKGNDEKYHKSDAYVIDANQPLNEVVSEVLGVINYER